MTNEKMEMQPYSVFRDNLVNEQAAIALGVDEVQFMDDCFNQTGYERNILEEREINVGWGIFPRHIKKEINHRFHAKFVRFRIGDKWFGCVIRPKIKSFELDYESMISELKHKISLHRGAP